MSNDQQSKFRSLIEFYKMMFLNKLNGVENIFPPPKKKREINIKRLWLKLCGALQRLTYPFLAPRVPDRCTG